MTHVGGIVLCGGQSSRMGRPKAWLPFGDEVMLQRVVRIVSTAVSPVVVVAAPGQEVPPLPAGVEVVRDEVEGLGPLGGLAAGLAALAGKCDAAYLSACDVPFLRVEFVTRMVELLNDPRYSICVPHIDNFFHPLAAVYRLSIRDTVLTLLSENRLRPVFLFDRVPTRIVLLEDFIDIDPGFESLRNLNTPAEYEAALREWEVRPWG